MKKNIMRFSHSLIMGVCVILLVGKGVYLLYINKEYHKIKTIEDGLQYRKSQISTLSLNYNCQPELKVSIENMIKHYNLNVPRYYKNIDSFNSLIYFEDFYWEEKIFTQINNLEVMEEIQSKCPPNNN